MEEVLKRGHQLIYHLELIQYHNFNERPQWTRIHIEDLKLFMAYTYYGFPFKADEESDDINAQINNINKDLFDYYDDDEKQNIRHLINIIQTKGINCIIPVVDVGITITHSICQMMCDLCQDFPAKDIHQWYLLRVKQEDTFIYIDFYHKKAYESWNDYVNNNALPKGYMFYPKSGFYDESKYLTQQLTPSLRRSAMIERAIDSVGPVSTFPSGVFLGAGKVFPVLSPILIPSATIITSFSTWEARGQIFKPSDLNQHSKSLARKETDEYWINIAVASLGVLTSPYEDTVRTLKLNNMTSKIRMYPCFAQNSICLTDCSLEIKYLSSKIQNMRQVTFNDVMNLRLDLFIANGLLLPINYVQELIKCIIGGTWSSLFFSTRQYTFEAACFIKRHIFEFGNQINKFIENGLTIHKFCCAIKQFINIIKSYKNHLELMTPDDLLAHIVNDTLDMPRRVKVILSGDHMKALLRDNFPAYISDIYFVKFCVKYVYDKALSLFEMLCDVKTTCRKYGYNNCCEIEEQFCLHYNLNQCTMKEFILNAIHEITEDTVGFLRGFNQQWARPDNIYKDLIIPSCTKDTHNIDAYFTTAPRDKLDEVACKNFARAIDQYHDNESPDYSFLQPECDISMLFSDTRSSFKLLIFTTNTDNGITSWNVCIYHSSYNRMD